MIRVWDIETGQCLNSHRAFDAMKDDSLYPVKYFNSQRAPMLISDGRRAIAIEDGKMRAWLIDELGRISMLAGLSRIPKNMRLCRSGDRVLGEENGVLNVWDLDSGGIIYSHRPDKEGEYLGTCFPQVSHIITVDNRGVIEMLNPVTNSRQCIRIAEVEELSQARISPLGSRITTETLTGIRRVWEASSGSCLCTLQRDDDERFDDSNVTPDGRYAVCSSPGDLLVVWDLTSGEVVAGFHCVGEFAFVGYTRNERHTLLLGDQSGAIYILEIMDYC